MGCVATHAGLSSCSVPRGRTGSCVTEQVLRGTCGDPASLVTMPERFSACRGGMTLENPGKRIWEVSSWEIYLEQYKQGQGKKRGMIEAGLPGFKQASQADLQAWREVQCYIAKCWRLRHFSYLNKHGGCRDQAWREFKLGSIVSV